MVSPQIPVKATGRHRLFSDQIEDEIARQYFKEKRSAREISIDFAPLSANRKLSESAVRAIARRSVARALPAQEGAA